MPRTPLLLVLALALVALLALPGAAHAGSEPCFGISSSAANNQVGYKFTCAQEGFSGSYTSMRRGPTRRTTQSCCVPAPSRSLILS